MYRAAARPDFVNRTVDNNEITGVNWLQKDLKKGYEVDDRTSDTQLLKFFSDTDLFKEWEKLLQFVIEGQMEGAKT